MLGVPLLYKMDGVKLASRVDKLKFKELMSRKKFAFIKYSIRSEKENLEVING